MHLRRFVGSTLLFRKTHRSSRPEARGLQNVEAVARTSRRKQQYYEEGAIHWVCLIWKKYILVMMQGKQGASVMNGLISQSPWIFQPTRQTVTGKYIHWTHLLVIIRSLAALVLSTAITEQ
jgi:hypothetical protein